MLSLQNFVFAEHFRGLTDIQLQTAITIVNAEFSGVSELWRICSPAVQKAKRDLCMSYLVAWQLMQMQPDSVVGISGMGGIPLSSKTIDDIRLKYKDLVHQDGSILNGLVTNTFGIQALLMIQSAPEMYTLWG